jgi:hypothetical protein
MNSGVLPSETKHNAINNMPLFFIASQPPEGTPYPSLSPTTFPFTAESTKPGNTQGLSLSHQETTISPSPTRYPPLDHSGGQL